MIGKSILHYRIIEKLGEGGMGIVYLAEDTKLKRQVAIKFLPHHISANSDERKRFEIEAQAAAALNHPNIATIYSIEEADDDIFLVMEYITGKHLKDHIKNQPLAVDEAIKTAIQIAEGLQAAHKKGIVHRDIKSANIMSNDDGNIKIMDFGLAKFGGSVQLTQVGTTLGTAAYMSPEQAKGEEVDHRADIWSFGVVLYEMLTGTLPFKGDYEQVVIFNILNEAPADINVYKKNIPDYLIAIILKCLQKNPSDRYQDFSRIITDLNQQNSSSTNIQSEDKENKQPNPLKLNNRIWASIAVVAIALIIGFFTTQSLDDSKERIPIAVVDFDNQTNEAELNGLSGLLITAMEQSQRLKVITRSRMLDILKQLGKNDVTLINEELGRAICKEAQINTLAIASIRKLGNSYAIDLKVLDPLRDEYLLTAKEVGEGQESVFAMIDNLAEKTREGLKEKAEKINISKQSVANVVTTNLEAYQHYFKGEEHINKLEWIEAEDEFLKATELDSAFAFAYYKLAYVVEWNGGESSKQHIKKAMQFIKNVPEKERYYIQGLDKIITGNSDNGIDIYKKLLHLYPDEKEAHYQIGDWSFHLAHYDTALKYLEKTLSLDPLFERAYQHIIWTTRTMRWYEKSLEYSELYLNKIPGDNAYLTLAETYYRKNDLGNTIKTFQKGLGIYPVSQKLIIGLGETYIFKQDYIQAEEIFSSLILKSNSLENQSEGYKYLGVIYAYLGMFNKAIHMMDMKIEIDFKLENNTALAADYAIKALWLFDGLNNSVKADEEILKGLSLQHYADERFFIPLFYYYLAKEEYQNALSISNAHFSWFPVYQVTLNAYIDKSQHKYDEAIKGFQQGTILGQYRSPTLYELGELYFDLEQYENAILSINKFQVTYQDFNDFQLRPLQYPRSFYLLGQAYEKLNDTKLAIESYQKLVESWQYADKNIPELIDTKKRLARLKGLYVK